MLMRHDAMSFCIDTGTVLPPIRVFAFPAASILRVIYRHPSSSGDISLSPAFESGTAISLNSADTEASFSPLLIRSLDGFAPRMRFIESMRIDFPAPVSPVRTLKPAPKSISAFFMTATFSICRDESMKISPVCSGIFRIIISSLPLSG